MIQSGTKALTIWQPYASLIVLGLKEFETRIWETKYRGPLVIHAAKRKMRIRQLLLIDWLLSNVPDVYHDQLRDPPYGAAVGRVELVDCKHQDNYRGFISERERQVGNWDVDYAWKLANPVQFESPISAKGYQGLWNWKIV